MYKEEAVITLAASALLLVLLQQVTVTWSLLLEGKWLRRLSSTANIDQAPSAPPACTDESSLDFLLVSVATRTLA
jgi:hypothetical protein